MGSPGFNGMFVAASEDPRVEEFTRGERETLLSYLHNYRLTLGLKCEGLDPEQLARQSVPPSDLSLLGLVRHMGRVEQHWFRRVMADRLDLPACMPTPTAATCPSPRRAAPSHAPRTPSPSGRPRSRTPTTTSPASTPSTSWGRPRTARSSFRDVLVHMIEEYARHCGHADLLRECIDGRTGQ